MGRSSLSNLYDFLRAAKDRPRMYVNDYSLDELELFCHGYTVALDIHGIEEFGTDFNDRFTKFLFRQYGQGADDGWGTARGWACDIREHAQNNESAFNRFFELLEEFRQADMADQ